MSNGRIKKLSEMMDKMGLTELDIEEKILFGLVTEKIHLSKADPKGKKADVKNVAAAAPVAPAAGALRSPMVGVVYLSPEPGAKTFTKAGAAVHAGDTLMLIEAMKTFNPVKADKDGTVKEILVADAQVVEFDTPLIIIDNA